MISWAYGAEPAPYEKNAITITVHPGARQAFAGFGASCGNWNRDYQKLNAFERGVLSQLMWRDLRMKTLRLWLNTNEYEPTPGARLTRDFRERYIDSGIIADARQCGVTELLLAPDNLPPHMKTKRNGGPEDFALKDESIGAYAALIAAFIKQIQNETGVLITATGIQNEPNNLDRISPEQFPAVVKAFRAALDEAGLRSVKLIAPESANVDGVLYDTLDRIKADAQAWEALGGIAAHSYNMAANEKAAGYIAAADGKNTKEFWMTEASANGPEAPGDAVQAVSLAARFLSDMNHRVTHWIHFIGFERPDPKDNATRIAAYTTQPLRTTLFHKYYYYQQLGDAFDVGAVFRRSESTLDGAMTWTYGKKPRVFVAAAQNPGSAWAIGVANFTAPEFNDDPKDVAGYANGYKARTFTVTVRVSELSEAKETVFTIHRSGAHLTNASEGRVLMRNGEVELSVGAMELVTLRGENKQ